MSETGPHFCQLCQFDCKDEQGFNKHVFGLAHAQKVMAAGEVPADNSQKEPQEEAAAVQEEFAEIEQAAEDQDPKPEKADKEDDMETEVAAEEETPIFYCDCCQLDCENESRYNNHCQGLAHMSKAMAAGQVQEDKSEDTNPERGGRGRVRNLDRNSDQQSEESASNKPINLNQYWCRLCQKKYSSAEAFKAHREDDSHTKLYEKFLNEPEFARIPMVRGTKPGKYQESRLQFLVKETLEPVLGVEYIIEYQMEIPEIEERYICQLCDFRLNPGSVMKHLLSTIHRLNFMDLNYPEVYETCNEEAIPDKTQRNKMVRLKAIEVEEMHGIRRAKVRIETDPYFDVRGQLMDQRPGDNRPPPNLREMSLMDLMDSVVNCLERNGLQSEQEARVANQVSHTLNSAIMNSCMNTFGGKNMGGGMGRNMGGGMGGNMVGGMGGKMGGGVGRNMGGGMGRNMGGGIMGEYMGGPMGGNMGGGMGGNMGGGMGRNMGGGMGRNMGGGMGGPMGGRMGGGYGGGMGGGFGGGMGGGGNRGGGYRGGMGGGFGMGRGKRGRRDQNEDRWKDQDRKRNRNRTNSDGDEEFKRRVEDY